MPLGPTRGYVHIAALLRFHLYSFLFVKGIGLLSLALLRANRSRTGRETRPYVVRIFLVDDNALIRSHLRAMLEEQSEWIVVGEASNGRDAVNKFHEHAADVTVMDFQMPEMNGLEAARRLSLEKPDVPILMVTVDPSRQLEAEARKVGIKGLCAKAHIRPLLDAIKELLRGRTYFPLGWNPA